MDSERMTDAQYDALDAYIQRVKPLLGLADWEIILDHCNPPKEEWLGACQHSQGRKRAHLAFRYDLPDQPEQTQRACVAHELVHCHFLNAQDCIRSDIYESQYLPQGMYQFAYDAFLRQLEYGVDAVAVVIAKMLPPIDWTIGTTAE